MDILNVTPDGVIEFDGPQSVRKALWDKGMAWRRPDRVWETRVWMLPSIFALIGKPEMSAEVVAGIKEAYAILKAEPVAVGEDYNLGVSLHDRGTFPYQAIGAGFLKDRAGALLADSVGLGKTCMSGTVLGHRLSVGGVGLIACTVTTKEQWSRELVQKVEAVGQGKVFTPHGNKQARREKYLRWARTRGAVLIVNHDLLRIDGVALREAVALAATKAESVTFIFDETGYIRNHTSKMFVAAFLIARLCTYRIALTATPLENTATDLWAVISWICPGYLGTISAFERRYVISKMIQSKYGPPWKKIFGYRNLSELKIALRPLYLRRTAVQVGLALPKIELLNVELDMTHRQRALYEEVLSRWDDGRIDAKKALLVLQMLCNDPPGADCPKLDEVECLVSEDWKGGAKTVIFTRFRTFAVKLLKRLQRFKPTLIAGGVSPLARDRAVQAFTDGSTRLIIATTAAERGLNLQAGSHLINVDLPWNPASYDQRIGRLHRIGSLHEKIYVKNIVMKDSIEYRVVNVMSKKVGLFDDTIETKGGDEIRESMKLSFKQLRRLA